MENQYQFFLISPLGLEKSCEHELLTKLAQINDDYCKLFDAKSFVPNLEITHGGIEFEAPLNWGLILNYYLKCPTRILMRFKQSKVRDFPKLFQILSKVAWKKYLHHQNVEFKITTSQSRIIDSRKVEKAAKEAIEKYFTKNAAKKSTKDYINPIVYLRFENDVLTLGIDTSGDALYKRSKVAHVHQAPLRENYAYALLQILFEDKKPKSLIDPMCGSGSLLREAYSFNDLNNQRSFIFETSPLFLHHNHLLKKLRKRKGQAYIEDLKGFDIDQELIKKNQKFYPKNFTFGVLDVLKNDELNCSHIISNIPFGKRVKTDFEINQLIKHLRTQAPEAKIALLMSKEQANKIQSPLEKRIDFLQGGLKVSFVIF